jgi:hypothetical protein
MEQTGLRVAAQVGFALAWLHSLIETIRNAETELELIMANSEPSENARRRNAVIAGEKDIQRGRVPREVLPMSDVIPFPQPQPSKSKEEEETAEFLALLERIRSSAKDE